MSGKCGAGCVSMVTEGIHCTVCKVVFHPKCAGMTLQAVRVVMQLSYFNWFCNACGDKYADAAVKAASAADNSFDQLSELRQLVVECSAKIDASSAANSSAWKKSVRPRTVPKPRTEPSAPKQFDRRRNLIIAGLPPAVSVNGTSDVARFSECAMN